MKNDKKSSRSAYARIFLLALLGILSVSLNEKADGVEWFGDFFYGVGLQTQLESFLWAAEAI